MEEEEEEQKERRKRNNGGGARGREGEGGKDSRRRKKRTKMRRRGRRGGRGEWKKRRTNARGHVNEVSVSNVTSIETAAFSLSWLSANTFRCDVRRDCGSSDYLQTRYEVI